LINCSTKRGHGGNVDEDCRPRHRKWQKRQRRQPSYHGAQHQLQLIFSFSSTTGRSSSLQSGYRHFKPGLQVADFQRAVSSTVSFNSRTDGSAHLKGGEVLTITTDS
jgi:hypothetical protein